MCRCMKHVDKFACWHHSLHILDMWMYVYKNLTKKRAQADVVRVVNIVAHHVHTAVCQNHGAPNKNIGDAFLVRNKMFVNRHACTCECMHACTCECMHACTCECMHACTCECMYMSVPHVLWFHFVQHICLKMKFIVWQMWGFCSCSVCVVLSCKLGAPHTCVDIHTYIHMHTHSACVEVQGRHWCAHCGRRRAAFPYSDRFGGTAPRYDMKMHSTYVCQYVHWCRYNYLESRSITHCRACLPGLSLASSDFYFGCLSRCIQRSSMSCYDQFRPLYMCLNSLILKRCLTLEAPQYICCICIHYTCTHTELDCIFRVVFACYADILWCYVCI